jgi:hypothetical protein
VTTKYLAKFQSPRAITRPKIIGAERNVNLICNSTLYTHIPNIKSISPSIAKKMWWQLNIWPNFKVQGYRSSLHFVPLQWFLAELWPLDFEIWLNIYLSPLFFAMLGDIDLIFGVWVYNDELQIKFTFRSAPNDFWSSYGPWTLKFGQIFSCHHFISLWFEILTWFLVWECISYRSTLKFICYS